MYIQWRLKRLAFKIIMLWIKNSIVFSKERRDGLELLFDGLELLMILEFIEYIDDIVIEYIDGLELLSTSFVIVVCQDSKVFLILKFPLSITFPFSKSIVWSFFHAWLAMLDPLMHFFSLYTCKDVFLSPSVKTSSCFTNVAP